MFLSRCKYGSRGRALYGRILLLPGFPVTVRDFIAGPCNWSPSAPVRLRQQVAENGASWQLYSTSRFLEGSEPDILSAVEVSGPTADSEINVELVPERLTTRWKDMGLRFATESHMNDIAFVDTLVKSLELAHRVKAIQALLPVCAAHCMHCWQITAISTPVSANQPCHSQSSYPVHHSRRETGSSVWLKHCT